MCSIEFSRARQYFLDIKLRPFVDILPVRSFGDVNDSGLHIRFINDSKVANLNSVSATFQLIVSVGIGFYSEN